MNEHTFIQWYSRYHTFVWNRYSFYALTRGFRGLELPDSQLADVLRQCCVEIENEARLDFARHGRAFDAPLFEALRYKFFESVFSAKQKYWEVK